jgi:hypothetical protein
MSKKKGPKVVSDGGPELTSAGVPCGEVPDFARPHVAWIDGRHGSAQSPLPSVDVVPVPDILNRLPYLHDDRPRGGKAMIDVAGARMRLRDVRPGAWLISPYTGWKWAKWPNGKIGWLPTNVELPVSLQVSTHNDIQSGAWPPTRTGSCWVSGNPGELAGPRPLGMFVSSLPDDNV